MPGLSFYGPSAGGGGGEVPAATEQTAGIVKVVGAGETPPEVRAKTSSDACYAPAVHTHPELAPVAGPAGPAGPKGDKGDAGIQGVQGSVGPAGPAGSDGLPGAAGPTGSTGSTGAVGPKGDKGDTGNAGQTGSQGPQGIPGTPGADGAAGQTGPKGDTGAQGLKGDTGLQGIQGPQGVPGVGGATTVKLAADHAPFTSTTLANITGLSFAVVAGTLYTFTVFVVFRTPALTTGVKLGLTCPAFTTLAANVNIPFAADGSGAMFHGFLTSSGDSVLSTAVAAVNTDYVATISGVILPSANGTVQLQAATEVAASAVTIRIGSHLSYLAV